MRRIALLAAMAAFVVVCWLFWPARVIPVECRLVEVTTRWQTRLDPPPMFSYMSVTFVVDASESVRALASEHLVYGELRVTPAGPHFILDGGRVDASVEGRVKCSATLGLDGSGGRTTADEFRHMIERREPLQVQMRIWDGSRVLAESAWMDAIGVLAPIAEQLR